MSDDFEDIIEKPLTGKRLLDHIISLCETHDLLFAFSVWLNKGWYIDYPWPHIRFGVEVSDDNQYKVFITKEILAVIDPENRVEEESCYWRPLELEDIEYLLDNMISKFGIPDQINAE